MIRAINNSFNNSVLCSAAAAAAAYYPSPHLLPTRADPHFKPTLTSCDEMQGLIPIYYMASFIWNPPTGISAGDLG